MDIGQKIEAFDKLGAFMGQFRPEEPGKDARLTALNRQLYDECQNQISLAEIHNPWFTRDFTREALGGLHKMLKKEKLVKWTSVYPYLTNNNGEPLKTIGTVLAGNIPMVGFHDFLCILISGNRFLGKLSSKDNILLDFFSRVLCFIEPGFKDRIQFEESIMKDFDAVIATGSNNSARYFEYYFRGYPKIIRKNRNGVAVLTGNEKPQELHALGKDIFTYFGLGCRNVSKIHVPPGYDLRLLLDALQGYGSLYQHNKYANNHDYQRSIFLLNQVPHLDNGFLLVKEDPAITSPIGVLHFEHYKDITEVNQILEDKKENIQCVVSSSPGVPGAIPPGQSQQPEAWEYADGVDTLAFLIKATGG